MTTKPRTRKAPAYAPKRRRARAIIRRSPIARAP